MYGLSLRGHSYGGGRKADGCGEGCGGSACRVEVGLVVVGDGVGGELKVVMVVVRPIVE